MVAATHLALAAAPASAAPGAVNAAPETSAPATDPRGATEIAQVEAPAPTAAPVPRTQSMTSTPAAIPEQPARQPPVDSADAVRHRKAAPARHTRLGLDAAAAGGYTISYGGSLRVEVPVGVGAALIRGGVMTGEVVGDEYSPFDAGLLQLGYRRYAGRGYWGVEAGAALYHRGAYIDEFDDPVAAKNRVVPNLDLSVGFKAGALDVGLDARLLQGAIGIHAGFDLY